MKSLTARLILIALPLAVTGGLSGCDSGHAAPPEAAAATTRYVAVARGSIEVEGGMLPISSTVAGVVAQVRVHVGDTVHKGQVLATLDDDDARATLDIARGKLRQAQARVRTVDVQLAAARRHAGTLAAAAAAGADAGQNAADAREKANELAADRAAAGAAVDVARGQVEQARHALALHAIRAPLAAQVTQVQVQPGESVSMQSGPLFTLLPDAPRIVSAEVNSDFIGHIHAGMQARVVLDDDSEDPVGMARVTVVGQVFGPSTLEEDPALRANIRTVKCRLRFDTPQALRVGQRVLVQFLRDAHARH